MRIPFARPTVEKIPEYLREGRHDLALEAVDLALGKDGENLSLQDRRAQVLALADRNEEAAEAYRQVAQAWAKKGFHAKAVAAYSRAVELLPDRTELRRELAHLIGKPFEGDDDEEESGRLEAASALFALFETHALEALIDSTDLREFDAGDIVVTEGEEGASLFVLVEGEVKVFTLGQRGEHVALTNLGPGELFGEVSVLSGEPRTATVTATERVTVIEIGKSVIDRVSEEHPRVRAILQEFCEARAENTIEALIHRRRGT